MVFATAAFYGLDAQDTIVKRNGEEINCIVKEIGTAEIKYVQEEINPDVIFTTEKREVSKIIFADGKILEISQDKELQESVEKNSEDLFLIQKKNVLKLDFISLVNNVMSLTYERCLKPGSTLEFSVGAVGIRLISPNRFHLIYFQRMYLHITLYQQPFSGFILLLTPGNK